MSQRYYADMPLSLGPVTLEGAEARHLATVCRIRAGEQVVLFNGDGREYAATVAGADRRRVTLDVAAVTEPERELPFHLEVAAPLPKGDRGPFLVEKLTELGVASFVLLATERSVVHPRATRLETLRRHVIEASKQCGRNVLMQLQPVTDWSVYCLREDLPKTRVIAHVDTLPEKASDVLSGSGALAVAVGPEGGFSAGEVATALAAGWRPAHLGPRILRVETAALAIATLAGMARVPRAE